MILMAIKVVPLGALYIMKPKLSLKRRIFWPALTLLALDDYFFTPLEMYDTLKDSAILSKKAAMIEKYK